MKRYLFTLLLAGLAMFTACTDDRDSNPTVQQPSTFELNMPALGGSVYDLANTDSIRLTYEQPDYGYTAPVKYYAQISVSGTWNDATSAEADDATYIEMDGSVTVCEFGAAADLVNKVADLKKALSDHTVSVLRELKAVGVTPKWVQVGNEIRPGMLWDKDKALSGASYDVKESDLKDAPANASSEVVYPMNWANLGAFITTGYDAVKSVCPDAIVIVHLDNGWDNGLFNWFFDELKKNGGKWDMIGMSLYPYWSRDAKPEYTAADAVITDCIKNIKAVSAKYNCDVMVVETGMECADDKGNLASASVLAEGKRQLARILKECKENTGGRCKGVFYWEPECRPNQYRLGAFTEDGRPTVIMDAFK